MLALLNVFLTQKNHWITAETEWTPWFVSVNIVELLSRARISSRSLIFTFCWGMGFGKLGHIAEGLFPQYWKFYTGVTFFRWNVRAQEVPGSIFTTSATTTLTASRDFFRTRGKGFFQRTCSIDDRHNQPQQDDIHRWPPAPESRSLNVFCHSTVALCSFWWKARWCAMPMVYQLYKLSV